MQFPTSFVWNNKFFGVTLTVHVIYQSQFDIYINFPICVLNELFLQICDSNIQFKFRII